MKILYWILAAASGALVVVGLTFFTSPDSANVAKEELDQWYVLVTILAAVLGGLSALGVGLLVPRRVASKAGENATNFHNRVILWGLGAGALGVLLGTLLAIQLAYGKADWQLSPAERVALVVGCGRFVLVPAAAWLLSSVVFTALVSTRVWKGRNALIGTI